jgi:uncharacterized membrane protein YidH (DUF202 family)
MVMPSKAGPDEPAVSDPANRTRLAWTRTAIAFAAIGAAMLKNSPVEGIAVLVLSVPIWAVARRTGQNADAMSSAGALRLVTATVVLVAVAAMIVALTGHPPASLDRLLHDS